MLRQASALVERDPEGARRGPRVDRLALVLAVGASVPDARVWVAPGEDPQQLGEVVGDGLVLLLFYPFDWSPT